MEQIHLKILLPSEIFADKTGVQRLVAETPSGSFGFLPHRLDCVAALTPGILTYDTRPRRREKLMWPSTRGC